MNDSQLIPFGRLGGSSSDEGRVYWVKNDTQPAPCGGESMAQYWERRATQERGERDWRRIIEPVTGGAVNVSSQASAGYQTKSALKVRVPYSESGKRGFPTPEATLPVNSEDGNLETLGQRILGELKTLRMQNAGLRAKLERSEQGLEWQSQDFGYVLPQSFGRRHPCSQGDEGFTERTGSRPRDDESRKAAVPAPEISKKTEPVVIAQTSGTKAVRINGTKYGPYPGGIWSTSRKVTVRDAGDVYIATLESSSRDENWTARLPKLSTTISDEEE